VTGLARLTFRSGPDDAHLCYVIGNEPSVQEDRREPAPFFRRRTRLERIDRTPCEWRRFSPRKWRGFHRLSRTQEVVR